MNDLIYIGSLSKGDALILAECAYKASKVLEYGVGASTQIFAQHCSQGSSITSLDTKQEWIETTKKVLIELDPPNKIEFGLVSNYLKNKKPSNQFDLIYIDGYTPQRRGFAESTWDELKVGGVMVFHDTRRIGDQSVVASFIGEKYSEISNIIMNPSHSHMTIIHKTAKREYFDWNKTERKSSWMSSAMKERPHNWQEIMRGR